MSIQHFSVLKILFGKTHGYRLQIQSNIAIYRALITAIVTNDLRIYRSYNDNYLLLIRTLWNEPNGDKNKNMTSIWTYRAAIAAKN